MGGRSLKIRAEDSTGGLPTEEVAHILGQMPFAGGEANTPNAWNVVGYMPWSSLEKLNGTQWTWKFIAGPVGVANKTYDVQLYDRTAVAQIAIVEDLDYTDDWDIIKTTNVSMPTSESVVQIRVKPSAAGINIGCSVVFLEEIA